MAALRGTKTVPLGYYCHKWYPFFKGELCFPSALRGSVSVSFFLSERIVVSIIDIIYQYYIYQYIIIVKQSIIIVMPMHSRFKATSTPVTVISVIPIPIQV